MFKEYLHDNIYNLQLYTRETAEIDQYIANIRQNSHIIGLQLDIEFHTEPKF